VKVIHPPWAGGLRNLLHIWRKPHIILDPDEGIVGPPGPEGPAGPPGPQGEPGVVENAELGYITARRQSDQAITNDTPTTVDFLFGATIEGTLEDFWYPSTPTYLTVQEECAYFIHGQVVWDVSSTGRRVLSIDVDGSSVAGVRCGAIPYVAQVQQVSVVVSCTVGQHISLVVTQTSGSALSLAANTYAPQLTMVKLKGMKGDIGATGPTGAAGPAGAQGPEGDPGTIIGMGTAFPGSPSVGDLFILLPS